MKFSANLGFLWTELELPDQIRAAAAAGFDAVECHTVYEHAPGVIAAALDAAGIPLIGLNTPAASDGASGIAATPGRETETRELIDLAADYAIELGCRYLHVVAGLSDRGPAAEDALRANLAYACERAPELTVVIEPMSERAVPGAHLREIAPALETINAVGASSLKLMFDMFHVQITEGDLTETIRSTLPHIGHMQFSAVPDRGEPDAGEISYEYVLPAVVAMGYSGWFGAEYRPRQTTDAGLGWLAAYDTQRTFS